MYLWDYSEETEHYLLVGKKNKLFYNIFQVIVVHWKVNVEKNQSIEHIFFLDLKQIILEV